MSAEIKERVSRLSDEEILTMLANPFPNYRREWIDFSEEELTKRGFVLERTDAELNVITPDGRKLIYPKTKPNTEASKVPSNNYEASSTKSSNRALLLIAIAVVVGLVAYFLLAPGNATLGYHLTAAIFRLISYSIILIVIAAVIAAVMGKFKTHTLLIFGWLFLAATLLGLGVAAFRKFVVEPQVRRALEQMERRR